MSQHTKKLAILFADICGSTALYESLGDDVARRMISRCIATMSSRIPDHRGTLVKTIGDEIMATFPDAEAAFHAACTMQAAVEEAFSRDDTPMHIRIGFNYGEVINESGDVFGSAVNIAARVAAITREGQIMVTQSVFDALPENLRGKMRHIPRTQPKGKHNRPEIYQVIYSHEDMLITRPGMPSSRKFPGNNSDEMLLRYRDQSLKVNKERRSVTLGRGDTCDVPIQADLASRLHSHIELHFGKFILVDQSTNGTYVRFSDGSEHHITREEIILHGKGVICLGQPFDEASGEFVEFSVIPSHASSTPSFM